MAWEPIVWWGWVMWHPSRQRSWDFDLWPVRVGRKKTNRKVEQSLTGSGQYHYEKSFSDWACVFPASAAAGHIRAGRWAGIWCHTRRPPGDGPAPSDTGPCGTASGGCPRTRGAPCHSPPRHAHTPAERQTVKVMRVKDWLCYVNIIMTSVWMRGKKLKYAFTEPARKRSMTTTKFTHNVQTFIVSASMDQDCSVQLWRLRVWNISAQLFFSFHIVRWIHRSINSPSKTKTLCSLHC